MMSDQHGLGQNSISRAWNKFNLGGGPGNRDIKGFFEYLGGQLRRADGTRRPLTVAERAEAIKFVVQPRQRPRLGASPLEAWWDEQGIPVGGPNPNGLRMRAVNGPSVGDAGVYLKVETLPSGRKVTKIGSADDLGVTRRPL